MEQSGRNRWQPVANGPSRKRLKSARTAAVDRHRLLIAAHGKEGVDGSSPSEGLQNPRSGGVFRSEGLALDPACRGYGAIHGAFKYASRPLPRKKRDTVVAAVHRQTAPGALSARFPYGDSVTVFAVNARLLTRVVLKNYKSIAACDVELASLVFLVGPNGAGKSNFVDALRFVADALRGSLDHALRERGGIKEVRRRSGGAPNALRHAPRVHPAVG
jgi:AAA domain, putative AbiEii toxin, Type IV TA system